MNNRWRSLLLCLCILSGVTYCFRWYWNRSIVGPSKFTEHAPAARANAAKSASLSSKPSLAEQFKPQITEREKARFMEALKLLTDALDSADIWYFMFGGTLIGSWRHHDMVPWDDDVDIIVNISDRKAVGNLTFPNHTMNPKDAYRYRLQCNDGTPSKGEPIFLWPFIDIIFSHENHTHIYWGTKLFLKSDTFPLIRRPLGDLKLYGPRHPLAMISYAADECQTRDWSHRDILKLSQVYTVDCSLLYGIYPFVIRNESNPDSSSTTERLYLNGTLLRTVTLTRTT